MPDDTIEGAELAAAVGPTVEALVGRGDLDSEAIPLLRTVMGMVNRDAPADILWDEFFAL